MSKFLSLKYSCYLLSLMFMASCDNEQITQMETHGIEVNTEMLKLTNDETAVAGIIEIKADVPEVDLEWIVSPECKLNTQFTKLYLENGKAELPVEWLKPFEQESALDGISFNAGVKISAGDESKYVSLVWGSDEDVAFNNITRATINEPKVSLVTLNPQQIRLNYQSGGATMVTLTNVASAIVDYSGITPAMNINLGDRNLLPLTLSGSTPLVFTWLGSAPATGFTANVIIYGTGVPAVTLELVYEPSGGGVTPPPAGDLQAGSIVPAGNIPDEGGTYYCNFTGTYTGQVMLRATKNGTELVRSSGNKSGTSLLLNVLVPGIGASNQATISFEYSKDGGTTWTLIENRTQIQETLSIYPIQPSGYIPAAGGTVTCSVYGTYSKKITVHARVGSQIVASNSGSVPSTISLQIPANPETSLRPVIFEYSKGGGPWLTLETKRQLGN